MARLITFVLFLFLSINSSAASTKIDTFGLDVSKIKKHTNLQGNLNPREHTFIIQVPRHDLAVTVSNMKLTSDLGLTSWVAFKKESGKVILTGELVLTEDQINPVINTTIRNNLYISSLHNHFLWENPRIMFMHIKGIGTEQSLTKAINQIFATIKTTSGGNGNLPYAEFDAAESNVNARLINNILGMRGIGQNGVYKITVPTKIILPDKTKARVPDLSTWVAFSGNNREALVNGDLVLTAAALQPVLSTLIKADIHIVGIHQQLVGGNFHLMSLHILGAGKTRKLAQNLRTVFDVMMKNNKPILQTTASTQLRQCLPYNWRKIIFEAAK